MFGLAMEGSLTFLAASPLVATPTVVSKIAAMSVSAPGQASVQSHNVRRGSRRARGPDGSTTTVGDAPDVSERGVDGDATRDANHTTDTRCIDARKVGSRVKIFDEAWGSPICPVGSLGAYDSPEAGIAVARRRSAQASDDSVTNLCGAGMTWDFVLRLRGIVKGKVLLKGIMTGEDAAQALRHGAGGIVVSNHGGCAEVSGQATIGMLVEVVEAVNGGIAVLIDGDARRGADVVKALALGATAVGVGRPDLWGLARFGKSGVDRMLRILR
jgi:hypothetical protein